MQKSINVIHYKDKLKEKTHLIISLDFEKAFDKIQHFIMIKVMERSGIQGLNLNIVKAINIQQTSSQDQVTGEKLEAMSLKSETR